MNKEEWKCCKCPKNKSKSHIELWSFGPYGNNQLKIEDSRNNNQYCEVHFAEKELEFSFKEPSQKNN